MFVSLADTAFAASRPVLAAVVAADGNWGIGRGGGLQVRLPPDLKRFRALTLGHTVVMGRKTFQSLPGSKALPGRRNVVLTRDPDAAWPDAETCADVEILLRGGLTTPGERVFVVGGARTYEQLLPFCEAAYVTRIESELPAADRFFPDLDQSPDWVVAETSDAECWNGIVFRYTLYKNRQISK